jgi:DNA-binding XRE family transcriptional regulator
VPLKFTKDGENIMESVDEKLQLTRDKAMEKFDDLPTRDKIKVLMRINGITQEEMAKLLGISRQAFHAWLKRDTWLERLTKVSVILDVPVRMLIK